ncbi:MAG: prepilin-type N-terminal cleavage/methylation domain-containing protein [Gemmatimonadota bacterium]|jgi:prepilin-type N-terminal cleavage/methylation domain-containing protein
MNMNAGDRGGFTLVELIVVTVLGALVVAASLQILITNQRTYTAQTAQIQGQQNTRAALDILTAEIREISPEGGDILEMGQTSVTVRVMRKMGVSCLVTTDDPPVIRAIVVGDSFQARDSVFIFADNNESTAKDDDWISAEVTEVHDDVTCGTNKANELKFGGQSAVFTADSVRLGGPIRSYLRYTYGLFKLGDGRYYLARRQPGKDPVPVVGPLKATNGLEFTYLDDENNKTTIPTEVRQIAIRIRTDSPVVNSLGEQVSDSISAWVFTRN